MLHSAIIAVCSEIHTKHINTQCGQNIELLTVEPCGNSNNQWAIKARCTHRITHITFTCTLLHIRHNVKHFKHENTDHKSEWQFKTSAW